MSLNIGTIVTITSATDGTLQPQDESPIIAFSDEEFESKGISVGDTVCYELVFVRATPMGINLILVEAGKTTVWNGGEHEAMNVGATEDTGALLLVKGGATVTGNSIVTQSTIIVEGGSTWTGNISATQRSVIGVQGASTINGSFDSLQGINVIVVEESTVTGTVKYQGPPDTDNDSMTIKDSDIDGDIIVDKPKSVDITNSDIGGDIIVDKPRNVNITGNNNGKTIAGNIDISRAGDVVVTDNKVDGAAGIKVVTVETCQVCNNVLAPEAPLDVPDACIAGC